MGGDCGEEKGGGGEGGSGRVERRIGVHAKCCIVCVDVVVGKWFDSCLRWDFFPGSVISLT